MVMVQLLIHLFDIKFHQLNKLELMIELKYLQLKILLMVQQLMNEPKIMQFHH
jgi:hypothetical protein